MGAPGASAAAFPSGADRAWDPRRPELQALRGVALLAVLLFQARLLPAGHLGLDLFFVLSGFLLADAVGRKLAAGEFRLVAFYLRRAARLLPALLVTLAAITALAPFLLAPADYGSFRAELFGALTLTANLVFYLQGDTVAAAGETRPLLHTFAPALLGQFVLLLPCLLILLPRRCWVPALAGLALASAGLALAFGSGVPGGAFPQASLQSAAVYLLPPRAFPFLIGAAAAVLLASRGRARLSAPFGIALLTALAALLALPLGPPVFAAAAVCLIAALLCASDWRWPSRGPLVRSLARLGAWSYSIYLVHWPLIAYANCAFAGEAPLWVRLPLLVVAVPLGALLWRAVEAPTRWGPRLQPRLFALRLAAATASCALFGGAVIGPLDQSYPRRLMPDVGLARACEPREARLAGAATCGSASHVAVPPSTIASAAARLGERPRPAPRPLAHFRKAATTVWLLSRIRPAEFELSLRAHSLAASMYRQATRRPPSADRKPEKAVPAGSGAALQTTPTAWGAALAGSRGGTQSPRPSQPARTFF